MVSADKHLGNRCAVVAGDMTPEQIVLFWAAEMSWSKHLEALRAMPFQYFQKRALIHQYKAKYGADEVNASDACTVMLPV